MRRILLIITLITMLTSTALAGEVQVTGSGSTEQNAIHQAMREAIEREAGTFIDARTLVENHMLISNEIYTNSSGYIQNYEVIRSWQENGLYNVEIKANVQTEKLKTALMSKLQKRMLIERNMNDPRIGIICLDESGIEYSEVSSEIAAGLRQQGFTRVVRGKASGLDYLVECRLRMEQIGDDTIATLAVNMRGMNTGEIIYSDSFTSGGGREFTTLDRSWAIKSVALRAAQGLSRAALTQAAQVEQHVKIIASQETISRFGRGISAFSSKLKEIRGVRGVFMRSMNSESMEVDVNFDGTTPELAEELERAGITIIEFNSEYIRI